MGAGRSGAGRGGEEGGRRVGRATGVGRGSSSTRRGHSSTLSQSLSALTLAARPALSLPGLDPLRRFPLSDRRLSAASSLWLNLFPRLRPPQARRTRH